MDCLSVGWKIAMWLILLGYMFTYVSMFLSGLAMMGIILIIKFIDHVTR